MEKGYYLAEACKNTFVIFDCLDRSEIDKEFILWAYKQLLEEKRDDALILIDGQIIDEKFYAKMLVLGVDGEFGEFCGNGARACAALLFSRYNEIKHFYLCNKQKKLELHKYGNDIYSVLLPFVSFELNKNFINKPEMFKKDQGFYFINFEGKNICYAEAIEPHLIIQEDMSDEELFQLGKKLNARKDIFPLGININAFKLLEDNQIQVKTYERGVQRLTLSCGTGSCSSASYYLKNKKGKIKVLTPGGILEISLKNDGLELKGPALIEKYKSI